MLRERVIQFASLPFRNRRRAATIAAAIVGAAALGAAALAAAAIGAVAIGLLVVRKCAEHSGHVKKLSVGD